jgi:hypothetical protein
MRTEEEKIMKAPVTVNFGGQEYGVRPLVIAEAREWRKKLSHLFSRIPQFASVSSDQPDAFSNALDGMMVSLPDEMVDLFFAYAKDLDREAIEKIATEEEVQIALMKVMDIALPLTRGIAELTNRLA